MRIDTDNCMSCGQCADECPQEAIIIRKTHGYARMEINQERCIDCGTCRDICPGECIYDN